MDKKEHWEQVYNTKKLEELSWYQEIPTESLVFFKELQIPTGASIIDIGGGDSLLADHLLDLGYTDITVLDISEASINRAKGRLGDNAEKIKWIVADVLALDTDKQFDCWHDRAAFHFLNDEQEIENYIANAQKHIKHGGKMIVGTFSTEGPQKCSGLQVKQYNEELISTTLQKWFTKIKCVTVDHKTPSDTVQNFLFCSFKKLNN